MDLKYFGTNISLDETECREEDLNYNHKRCSYSYIEVFVYMKAQLINPMFVRALISPLVDGHNITSRHLFNLYWNT